MSDFLSVFKYSWKERSRIHLTSVVIAAHLIEQLKRDNPNATAREERACLSVAIKFCQDSCWMSDRCEYDIVCNYRFRRDPLLVFFSKYLIDKKSEQAVFFLFEEIYLTELRHHDRRTILIALWLLVKHGKPLRFHYRRRISNFLSLMSIIARKLGHYKVNSLVLRYYINLKRDHRVIQQLL